jgi:5'-methylthioadenosine phosphorylase
VDIIGMTALPEAKLAREAELCYAVLAFVTDYDVWHSSAEAVTVDMVIKNLAANIDNAQRIVHAVTPSLAPPTCACGSALRDAIMTAPERIPAETRQRLGLLIGRYVAVPDVSPAAGEIGKSTGES